MLLKITFRNTFAYHANPKENYFNKQDTEILEDYKKKHNQTLPANIGRTALKRRSESRILITKKANNQEAKRRDKTHSKIKSVKLKMALT